MEKNNTVIIGDLAELQFAKECLKRNILCSKPVSNSYPYDFIVDSGTLKRVQVKASNNFKTRNKEYTINTKRSGKARAYGINQVDVFAIYLYSLDIWYFIPSQELEGKTSIALNPTVLNTTNKYEKYRLNWKILND